MATKQQSLSLSDVTLAIRGDCCAVQTPLSYLLSMKTQFQGLGITVIPELSALLLPTYPLYHDCFAKKYLVRVGEQNLMSRTHIATHVVAYVSDWRRTYRDIMGFDYVDGLYTSDLVPYEPSRPSNDLRNVAVTDSACLLVYYTFHGLLMDDGKIRFDTEFAVSETGQHFEGIETTHYHTSASGTHVIGDDKSVRRELLSVLYPVFIPRDRDQISFEQFKKMFESAVSHKRVSFDTGMEELHRHNVKHMMKRISTVSTDKPPRRPISFSQTPPKLLAGHTLKTCLTATAMHNVSDLIVTPKKITMKFNNQDTVAQRVSNTAGHNPRVESSIYHTMYVYLRKEDDIDGGGREEETGRGGAAADTGLPTNPTALTRLLREKLGFEVVNPETSSVVGFSTVMIENMFNYTMTGTGRITNSARVYNMETVGKLFDEAAQKCLDSIEPLIDHSILPVQSSASTKDRLVAAATYLRRNVIEPMDAINAYVDDDGEGESGDSMGVLPYANTLVPNKKGDKISIGYHHKFAIDGDLLHCGLVGTVTQRHCSYHLLNITLIERNRSTQHMKDFTIHDVDSLTDLLSINTVGMNQGEQISMKSDAMIPAVVWTMKGEETYGSDRELKVNKTAVYKPFVCRIKLHVMSITPRVDSAASSSAIQPADVSAPVEHVEKIKAMLCAHLRFLTRLKTEHASLIVNSIDRGHLTQLAEMIKYLPIDYKFVDLRDIHSCTVRSALYRTRGFIPDKSFFEERSFPVYHRDYLDEHGQIKCEGRLLCPLIKKLNAWMAFAFVRYDTFDEYIQLQFGPADSVVLGLSRSQIVSSKYYAAVCPASINYGDRADKTEFVARIAASLAVSATKADVFLTPLFWTGSAVYVTFIRDQYEEEPLDVQIAAFVNQFRCDYDMASMIDDDPEIEKAIGFRYEYDGDRAHFVQLVNGLNFAVSTEDVDEESIRAIADIVRSAPVATSVKRSAPDDDDDDDHDDDDDTDEIHDDDDDSGGLRRRRHKMARRAVYDDPEVVPHD